VREPDSHLTIRVVDAGQAPLVRSLMLAGFAQLADLDPPSSALWETDDDVAAAINRGGAAVAWLGAAPVGTVRWEPEDGWIYISRLAVIPEARRKGVASALMTAAEAGAARFGLHEAQVEMRSVLTGNQALFRGLGYEVAWIRPHPRNPASTTVRMRKLLS
jgi:ribosomal protein S18 acetylase RimI-like enzyme